MENVRIEYMPIGALPKALRNPKAHDIPALIDGIRRRGFNDPVTINEATGRLVEGHGRIEALTTMKTDGAEAPKRIEVREGEWLVPVVRGVRFDTDAEAEAYLLEHNQLSIMAGWDNGDLAKVLQDIAKVPEIKLIGWSDAAVDKIIRRELGAGLTEEDEVPDLPAVATSKVGEVWQLGDHILYVGSCEQLSTIVANQSIKIMFTDPPYGVDYGAKNAWMNALDRQAGNKASRIESDIEGDIGTPDEMQNRWEHWFKTVRPLLSKGCSYYITGPSGDLFVHTLLALVRAGMPMRHMLVWDKERLVLGRSDYQYQHEPIMYGWIEGGGHKRIEDRTETTIWKIPNPKKSDLHPTMKPVELYARAYRNSSDRGDLALEMFSGSGTAFIAGRRAA